MSKPEAKVTIPLDLTNPGQFFACCGLLELADRLWPGAEGWFDGDTFNIRSDAGVLEDLMDAIRHCEIANTMTPAQLDRLEVLSKMPKKQREATEGAEEEKKLLESLRRELPIVLSGNITFRIDWFLDELAGGSRFKTWAGQQSVLDIATAMHQGLGTISELAVWDSARGIGLPFNFDSDLGGQGSALDIGFSFDPLAGSAATRIEGTCKPALEFLCFIGLQRFRPREIPRKNRFVFSAWSAPLAPSVASAVACGCLTPAEAPRYEFKLLYRTKYLKSFLPSIPYQGESDE
jgi:CRISPR-associated protein Csb3